MKQMVVAVLLCTSLALGCSTAKPIALGSGQSSIPPRPAGATYSGWEHYCVAVSGEGEGDLLSRLLTEAGKEGWELVLAQSLSNLSYFCFKRPLIEPAGAPVAGERAGEAELAEAAWEDKLERGIQLGADGIYAVDVTVLREALSDPMRLLRRARLVPVMQDGKASGLQVYAIRPRSFFDRVGLRNGDLLTSANAFSLASAEQALTVYEKLRDASNIELEVVRAGKPLTLRYAIR
jgi:hypothetical protein